MDESNIDTDEEEEVLAQLEEEEEPIEEEIEPYEEGEETPTELEQLFPEEKYQVYYQEETLD